MNSSTLKKNQISTNGRWKKSQHDKFMKALEKYGRDWVKVQKMVKTRNLAQIRSHAQKAFLKMSDVDIEALIAPEEESGNLDYYHELAKKKKQKKISLQNLEQQESGNQDNFNKSERSENKWYTVSSTFKEGESNIKTDIKPADQQMTICEPIVPLVSNKKSGNQAESFFMMLLQDNISYLAQGTTFIQLFLEKKEKPQETL